MWDQYCLEEVAKWPDIYIHRMSAYNKLKRSHDGIVVEDYVPRPKILVDLDLEEDSIVLETVDLVED
ncbi:hypothetical protein A2U01_0085197 [Trifolium medium]|uniref:Uncharacterized protein n=1 Tax=Trifolium medium TaxID=97028 RepID=A0A392TUI1_9FABA|nr:hypothetical protein [Trifolium medium]